MPGQFLTQAEREKLSSFPPHPTEDDIIIFFGLTASDLNLINKRSGDYNRLGYALQLGTLRYLGFVPDDLQAAPFSIVNYLAQQLQVNPSCLVLYGKREKTRTNQLQQIQAHLGWRKSTQIDMLLWENWLLERAMEHDRPLLLFQLICDKLRTENIVRPGVTTLERMVINARSKANLETFNRIQFLLTTSTKLFLDSLLERDDNMGKIPITWLRLHATTNSPNSILNALSKLTFLAQHDVTNWNLSSLNPNRLKFLAQLGKKSSNQALKKINQERRYPILVAFVFQIFEEVTDETMDLYIHCLGDIDARARRDLKEFHLHEAKSTNEKVRLLKELGQVILDEGIKNEEVRASIYQKITPEKLQAVIEDCQRLIRPNDDNHFDFLANRYGYIRRFAPVFFAVFTFNSHQSSGSLIKAIKLLRELDAANKRKIPNDAPQDFISPKWANYVFDDQGEIVRRYYEMCLLWELRRALRSGDIWLENSRRYANPESYLIPQEKWPSLRPEVCQILQLPLKGKERLQQQQEELDYQLEKLHQTLQDDDKVRLDEEGELIISPLQAEDLPFSAHKLQQLIRKTLPQIDLSELLMEMDKLSGFSYALTHAGGNISPPSETKKYLYAAILAQGTNLGLSRMAMIANLSYDRLVWFTNWYLREETLKEANITLVNFQYHQWLSQFWGGGTLSSSDGQRFPVAVNNRQAVSLPRYFGYGKGLTFYTWTSDQQSQYGDKVIPSTMKDAPYLLDAILDNETELSILEHTTDTAGYTDVMFALFDLLGLQFSPRLRALKSKCLYLIEREIKYPHLKPLFKGKIHLDYILNRWDDLLRVVGSLKFGWVTSSLFIGKLKSFPQQNGLLRALEEYGRLVKTNFILRYLNSEDYRRRINTQLNKGEKLHDLRRFLFFAHLGLIRHQQDENLANQSACLTLVTNAVVTWNTIYMQAAIEQLSVEGLAISSDDFVHLSPARYEHINPYGRYEFDVAKTFSQQELRPLRTTRSQ
ncbi:MAG: Tn3 family transposase [Calothrix sp. MO_167.B12]|nr:Tn3 family transposase [Calothrix sp. MO_167.B12]